MTRFELLVMLHGIGVVAWVGGGLTLLLLHVSAARADDYTGLARAVRQSQTLGAWLYGPASLITAATGVALVATEDTFAFTDLWILVGIGGLLLSIVMQTTVADRARSRYLALLADDDEDQARLRVAARTVTRVNAVDIALLFGIVWVMYARPDL
jgi:uncharacterized membrane protein